MVDYDNMGPSLVGTRLFNFLLSKLSCDVKLREMSILHDFKLRNVGITGLSKGHISLLLEVRVTWSGMLVVLYVLCMLMSRSKSHSNNHKPPSGASNVYIFF